MFYQLYELNHAALQPFRAFADATRLFYSNPLNPLSQTPSAARPRRGGTLRAHDPPLRQAVLRPRRDLDRLQTVKVTEKIVWSRPFCNLIHFKRDLPAGRRHPSC